MYCWMDGWMDRWMDGQIDGQMDRQMYCWMEDRQMDGKIDKQMDRQMDGWIDRWMLDEWMDGWWTDSWKKDRKAQVLLSLTYIAEQNEQKKSDLKEDHVDDSLQKFQVKAKLTDDHRSQNSDYIM